MSEWQRTDNPVIETNAAEGRGFPNRVNTLFRRTQKK
jgi:hypothetical protein